MVIGLKMFVTGLVLLGLGARCPGFVTPNGRPIRSKSSP
jgi:hypothetical protein